MPKSGKKYYVYHLIDPRNNLPFYVGASFGNPKRMYQHEQVVRKLSFVWDAARGGNPMKFQRIVDIIKSGNEVITRKVFESNNLEETAQREAQEIYNCRAAVGNDIMTNISDNASGCYASEESLKKLKESMSYYKGENNPSCRDEVKYKKLLVNCAKRKFYFLSPDNEAWEVRVFSLPMRD